jgi:hypothetical protein
VQTALEGVGESSSIVTKKKANGEPAFKKPRLETPSPLPTFKVHTSRNLADDACQLYFAHERY